MRAILRISRRSVTRHPWRSSIVVLLVALPVAVLCAALLWMGGVPNSSPFLNLFSNAAGQIDSSLSLLRSGEPRPDGGLTDLAGPNQRSADDLVSEARQFTGLSSSTPVDVWRQSSLAVALPQGGVELHSWLQREGSEPSPGGPQPNGRLVDGRWPNRANEVVVGADEATRLGDVVHSALPRAELTVVGRLDPKEARPFGWILGPGTFADVSDADWERANLGTPTPVMAIGNTSEARRVLSRLGQAGFGGALPTELFLRPYESADNTPAFGPLFSIEQLATIGLSTFGFAWMGLIAASALAIGARRRRRELGLLCAAGATPAQVRGAVVADGVVLGGVGALLGAGLALSAAGLLPDRWVGGWRMTPLAIAAPLLGWASAIGAGYLAGRRVATQPAVDLLAGRSPRVGRPREWVGLGAAALGICAAATVISNGRHSSTWTWILMVVAVASGFVTAIAWSTAAVRLVGLLPGNRSFARRTAARDLARFGPRTAAAVAAIAVTLSAATGAAVAQGAARTDRPPKAPQAEGWVLVHGSDLDIIDGRVTDGGLNAAEIERVTRAARRIDGARSRVLTLATSGVSGCATSFNGTPVGPGAPTPGTPGSGPLPTAAQIAEQTFDADGCVAAGALQTDSGLIDLLEPSIGATAADHLRSGEIVVVSNIGGVAIDVTDPELRVGDTRFPVAEVVDPTEMPTTGIGGTGIGGTGVGGTEYQDTEDGGGDERQMILNAASSIVVALVPDQVWSADLTRLQIHKVAVVGPPDDRVGWKRVLGTGSQPGGGLTGPTPWSTRGVLAAGASVAVLCLAILALALILVRIESRDEESVLTSQGADRSAIARVLGWRAALCVWAAVAVAVPATLLLAWLILGRVVWPHPLSFVSIVVGLPVIAGALFGLPGLRTPRPPRLTV